MDKEIPDIETAQGGATKVAAGDKVHVYRGVNSRVATLDAQLPATPASSSGPASMEFAEDTDNGSNKVTVQAPAALAADVTVTLPSKAGTVALESDADRRNQMLIAAGVAKALVGYQRFLDMVAFGFKASGDADVTSTGGTVDTSAGAWKPDATNARITGATPSAPLGGTAANLNDNNTATVCTASPGDLSAAGINSRIIAKLDLGSSRPITAIEVVGLSQATGSNSTTGLHYSTDNTNWTQLGANLPATSTTPTTTTRSGSVTARYVAVILPALSFGVNVSMQDLNAYEVGPAGNATLITPYQTADAARTKVRGIFEIDNVDAGTLGTHWTVEYTCNGGTNWSSASTYTNCGKGQSGRTVVETEEVTCTSGTSFAARVKNLSNKRFDVYKAALKAAA